jgi:hypothetical protein
LIVATALSVLLSGVQIARRHLFTDVKKAPELDVKAVQVELASAHKSLVEALDRANAVATTVVEISKMQQDELTSLRARYDSLKALTAGQEEIVRSYRAILNERSWSDRGLDNRVGEVGRRAGLLLPRCNLRRTALCSLA